jgi:hypothetical protein
MMQNKFPNLHVIGAMRSATTTLWRSLGQHPEIFMSPVKEPRYFATRVMDPAKVKKLKDHKLWDGTIFDENDYLDLFKNVKEEKIIGEASPLYLPYADVAKHLIRSNPSAKLLVSLRHPVDRALSHFHHFRRIGAERRDNFLQAFYEDYISDYAGYFRLGLYYRQIKPFFDVFPPQQIKIILFKDLLTNSKAVFRSIFQFLDVDPDFVPAIEAKSKKKNILSDEIRNCIILPFFDDIINLSELIDTDVSEWTEGNRTSPAVDEKEYLFSPYYYLS